MWQSHIDSDVFGDYVCADAHPFTVTALLFIGVATVLREASKCFEAQPPELKARCSRKLAVGLPKPTLATVFEVVAPATSLFDQHRLVA
jgi:hypothetical protein